MFSRNDWFECRWRPSRRLFQVYCAVASLALCSAMVLQVPASLRFLLLIGVIAHAAWALPRHVLLSSPAAVIAIRRTPEGWAMLSRRAGWHPVQLLRDSLALPAMVLVRYRRPGQWFARAACIPADALDAETHRRLRLRLRLSRNRFAAPSPGCQP